MYTRSKLYWEVQCILVYTVLGGIMYTGLYCTGRYSVYWSILYRAGGTVYTGLYCTGRYSVNKGSTVQGGCNHID